MTDGLGRRQITTDAATGEPVEHLELSADLVVHTAFASALADRVTRLAAVRHASYVHVRRVDRPAADRLIVVSNAIEGHRLSDLLEASAASGLRPGIEVVVGLLRQLLPAAALFSRHKKDQGIGTLAPERLFIVSPARVVIGDAVFGAAIDKLTLSQTDAWRRFRIAAPPSEAPVSCTARADATALGVVALSMLLGRLLTADEYPDALPALVSAARERHGHDDHPLSSVFDRWLRRALQIEAGGFDSPQAAQIGFEEVLAADRRYMTGTIALEEWTRRGHARHAGAKPEAQREAGPEDRGGRPGAALAEASTLPETPAEPQEPPRPEAEPLPVSPGPEEATPDLVREAQAPPRRLLGLRPQWAAVIVGVLLMQAAAIAWFWSRPAPGPAPGQGELVVTSRPAGATVVIDGRERGVTPLTVTLDAGPHVVEVRTGTSEPRVIPLVIRANIQTAQYVELQDAAASPPDRATPAPPGR